MGILGNTLGGGPGNFPALPNRFTSFQIVRIAVDNVRDPAGTLKATQR